MNESDAAVSLSLVGETQAIMAGIAGALRAQGWRFESVTKATTHDVGLPVAAFPLSPSRIAVDVLGVIE